MRGRRPRSCHREGLARAARDARRGPTRRCTTARAGCTLSFDADGRARSVRVPPGVTVFDAASLERHRDRLHLRRARHLPQVPGAESTATSPVTRHDVRTFTTEQLADGLAAGLPGRRRRATSRSRYPRSTTRPKAATVGVGRQVILRPAVQKRYVELAEPTLADQRTDLERLRDAIDDLELERRPARPAPAADRAARRTTSRSRRSIVDEALIDVEPGDTTGRAHAIAFDLGTTTVVATLLDLDTGTPLAVASMLNKQQPFGGDVITRISATMMDPEALAAAQRGRPRETLAELAAEVCAEAGVDPAHGLRGRPRGQRDHDRAACSASTPSRWASRPFVMSTAHADRRAGQRPRACALHPRARAVVFPALGRVRRRRHRRRDARHRHGPRQARAAVHRRRHQLRDRPQRRRHGSSPPPRRRARPSRAARSAAACAPPTAPSRWCGSTPGRRRRPGLHPRRDRRRRRPTGLCGSGLVDAVAELVKVGPARRHRAGSSPTSAAAELAPALADRLTKIGEERVFVLAPARRRTRRPRSASTSRSATCASCSSPRPRSRRAGRCCSRSSASSTATSSRCCSPARSAATSPRPRRCGSGWCRSCRCCGSSPPATSPARARRWRCSPLRERAGAERCWRR